MRKSTLRTSAALQALALLGAGLPAVFIAATPAHAQDYTNVTVSGTVVGTNGQPIPNATVQITSNEQGFTRTTTTDSSGGYRISQVPTGNYTFQVSASGFEGLTDANVQIGQDTAANQFALRPATANEGDVIVVTAGRQQIADFERTTTGAVINVAEVADQVPVGRDLTSIIKLAPGTAQGDAAFGNLASIAGSSVAENAFFVNGLNITEFRKGLGSVTVPFEFYETVEIKNGGYQAEFGRSTGGVVNAITKSGSNQFHGGVMFTYEPDELQKGGSDVSVPATGAPFVNNSADIRERKEANFYLSGPILKDRLFFFGLFNPRSVRVGDAVATANRYDMSRTNDPFFGGKVDFVPFDGQRLEFTYFDTSGVQTTDSYSFDNDTNEIGGFSSSQLLTYGGKNWVGRYTGNFTEWLTLSAAYGKNKASDSTVASRPDYPTIIDNRSGTPQNIGNPTNIQELANDERKFIRGDVDVLVNLFGSHHFRAGYDREKLTSNNTAEYTGNVTYQYYTAAAGDAYAPAGTQYVSARTFINGGIFTSENRAFYLQDNWSLMNNRLQLQLGIRNDRFENRNVDGETFYDSGDQWGPRVGFTFDVLNNNRSKLYGSFGRYFLPIASNTNIRLAGAEFDLTRYNVLNGLNADNTPIIGAPLLFAGADACFDTGILHCENISDGTATPTEATVAKNLEPQSMDEWILGYEHRLPGRMRVGIYGTYRKLNAALEDAAIDAAVLAYCDAEGITGCDQIWTGFHQYVLINPGNDAVVTLSDPINGETALRTITLSADDLGYPAAKRIYKAITATFNRDFDGKWMAAGSYTYSSLKGNYEGAVKSDNGQDDAGITTDFDQPGLALGSYGYLPNHRAHTFKAYGAYQLTPWLLLGANVQVTSPRKFGCIGRIPATVDPFAALYGAAGWFCHVDSEGNIITTGSVPNPTTNPNSPGAPGNYTSALTPRGSRFESDWLKEVNLSAAFKLPVDSFGATLRLDVFNILNEQASLDFEERGTFNNGTPRNTYGLTSSFQRPRFVRLALGVEF